MKHPFVLLGLALLLASCMEQPEAFDNTPQGNLDAFVAHHRHALLLPGLQKASTGTPSTTSTPAGWTASRRTTAVQLFDLCADMLAELRDGHVNLYSDFDLSRYDKWYTDSAANFNAAVIRDHYIQDGRLRTAGGLQYGLIKGARHRLRVLRQLLQRLLVDQHVQRAQSVRALQGADYRRARQRRRLAQLLGAAGLLLFQADTHTGYMRYKSGPGHNDFAEPTKVTTPAHGSIYWGAACGRAHQPLLVQRDQRLRQPHELCPNGIHRGHVDGRRGRDAPFQRTAQRLDGALLGLPHVHRGHAGYGKRPAPRPLRLHHPRRGRRWHRCRAGTGDSSDRRFTIRRLNIYD